MAVSGITHKYIAVGRIQQMKKLSIVFIIIFSVFCSACSSSKGSITKEEINGADKNAISVDNKESEESVDLLQTKQVDFPDYTRYKALIDRVRMAIGCSEKEYLAGWDDNFVIQSDGSLWMWNNRWTFYNEPRAKKILDDVVDFAANGADLLIIRSDASLWIWERDLGDGSLKGEPIHFMDNVADVANTYYTSMAIQLDGSLWTWESIQGWEDGIVTIVERQKPVKIMEDVVSMSISQSNFGIYAMAIQSNGNLWAWGDNSDGQLGDGTTISRQEPVKVMENVVSVSTTEIGTSMALCSDGSLWAWGDYIYGYWGGCPEEKRCNPVKVFDDAVCFSINSKWGSEAYTMYILAVKSDGSLWGWGGNTRGELGIGNTECSAEPVHIMNDIVYAYAFSANFTMAVDTDENVWFMGRKENLFGEESLYPYLIDIRNGAFDLNVIDTDIQEKAKDYKVSYREKIRELILEDETARFSLIYLTGSDMPELVAEHSGYDISVFTCLDGESITLMDQWPYGAGGSTGYEYLPGNNIIRNVDMDYAGAVIYETYLTVNDDYEVVELFDEGLSIWYFRDINGDGMIDEEEYCDEPVYYYGDSEISEEEYAGYQVRGDFESICGELSAEEILAQLDEDQSDIQGYISDDSRSDYYEPIENYWKLSGAYSDSTGSLTISLSIYSSQEEGEMEIGTADIYANNGQHYVGSVTPVEKNVYKIATDTGEEVLLIEEDSGDVIMLQLYVDGQYLDEYQMVEHYES